MVRGGFTVQIIPKHRVGISIQLKSALLQTKASTCNSTILLTIQDGKSKQATAAVQGVTKTPSPPDLPDVDPCLGSTLDSVHRKQGPLGQTTKTPNHLIVCRRGAPLGPRRRFEEFRVILPILTSAKKYMGLKRYGNGFSECEVKVGHMDALKVCASPERCKQNARAKFRIHKVPPPPSSQRPNLAFLRNMHGCFAIASEDGNVQHPRHPLSWQSQGQLLTRTGHLQKLAKQRLLGSLCCRPNCKAETRIPVFHPYAILNRPPPAAILTGLIPPTVAKVVIIVTPLAY
mmetsp:Transcript_22097/g.36477  ORF Transcript_22097/g.36477 Transcript_22097/m.36477 type:complete len:288 (+) Transcript_22097:986-1849(+)